MRAGLLGVVLILALAPGPSSGAATARVPEARTARAGALIGIADEHVGMFYSLAFRKLRVHISRLIVPWDTFLRRTRDMAWVTQWVRVSEIVAADVLDQPGFVKWLRRFRHYAHGRPSIWGLHNYEDTNHHISRDTRSMLRTVPGQVWLTETGGIVKFGHWRYSPRRAAGATSYMFRLAGLSPRITRPYIYQWSGARRRARFDAGLTGPTGHPRPAYFVVQRHLVHGSRFPPGFHPPAPPAPRPIKPIPGPSPPPPGPPPSGGGGGSGSGSGGGSGGGSGSGSGGGSGGGGSSGGGSGGGGSSGG